MKKKFWGFQSYWKWYGLAMTLIVTIISADNHPHHIRNQHNQHRKKSLHGSGKAINQTTIANISMDDYMVVSQLERVPPIPNTTEFHFEKITERYCK